MTSVVDEGLKDKLDAKNMQGQRLWRRKNGDINYLIKNGLTIYNRHGYLNRCMARRME